MTRSMARILTKHCGSLARPHDLLDLMKARLDGQDYAEDAYARRVRAAVAHAVLPDGKALIPGVITHASNIVEHPELIAERLTRFAKMVGSDRVIASADCGFSSQATYKPEVHPKVMWAKFAAMVEGARLANSRLKR